MTITARARESWRYNAYAVYVHMRTRTKIMEQFPGFDDVKVSTLFILVNFSAAIMIFGKVPEIKLYLIEHGVT